jgi:hypothetical protein
VQDRDLEPRALEEKPRHALKAAVLRHHEHVEAMERLNLPHVGLRVWHWQFLPA